MANDLAKGRTNHVRISTVEQREKLLENNDG